MTPKAVIFWPDCWKYSIKDDVRGGDKPKPTRYIGGKLTQVGEKNKLLVVYKCLCGSHHTKIIGESVEESREWVRTHAPHLEGTEHFIDTNNWDIGL